MISNFIKSILPIKYYRYIIYNWPKEMIIKFSNQFIILQQTGKFCCICIVVYFCPIKNNFLLIIIKICLKK